MRAIITPSSSSSLRIYLLYLLLSITLIIISTTIATTDNNNNNDDDNTLPVQQSHTINSESSRKTFTNNNNKQPKLTSESVVLITGAAGFIGSELAITLKRTYNIKKLLLVDNLGLNSENERSFVPPPKKKGGDDDDKKRKKAIYEKFTEEELSLFEYKRQRAFRIFHELTSPEYNNDDYNNFIIEDGEEEEVVVMDDVSSTKSTTTNNNNNKSESIRFYRADMRPSIPEYFDFGEVPLLEGIFMSHPDITHVVHLADVPLSDQNQAIPRNKDSVKTGRMEGLLEEMRLMIERASASSSSEQVQLPQFVYASSHEVYDSISTASSSSSTPQQPNPPPFQEDKPITTPSSLHGTAKLIDEVLASAYHSTHGIYSVGLRFFNVYGPWNAPGTDVFDLAERISTRADGEPSQEENGSAEGEEAYGEDINDYIYIDDAVDAIMSAMQYRPPNVDNPPPVVFNVGSGQGHTLKDIRESMSKHFPSIAKASSSSQASKNSIHADRIQTTSIASTSRSESLLGFKAQVSIEEGLAHTLTWHRDRSHPYGRDPRTVSVDMRTMDGKIADSLAISRRRAVASEDEGGDDECSPLDRECLNGEPIFPCASECRRTERCTPSAWDDVSTLSKMVTTGCDAVLYTILLDDTAEQIPSATTTVLSSESMPYVGAGLPEDVGKRTEARCNIAFVSDKSPLVKRLKSEGEEYLDEENATDGSGGGSEPGGNLPPLLRHGFWTVLPVPTPSSDSRSSSSSWQHAFDGTFALEYLPKLSPGRFFGSSVRYAAYVAPSVLVKNLPNLLKWMEDGPPSINKSGSSPPPSSSRTALLLAAKHHECDPAQRGSTCTDTYTRPSPNDALQSHMYNMIRMALRGEILGGGLDPSLDSTLLIHSLREEDSRLFRCDVYGEAAQWGVSSDERAFEFIISLHDLWNRAVVHWSMGLRPWWVDIGTETAADGANPESESEEEQLLGGEVSNDAEQEGTWMGVLSSTDVQLFTHIIPPDNGIVQL